MAELVMAARNGARDLAAIVSAFISAEKQKPWQPGHVDCCMVLANWAMWLGHADPAPHLRGHYHDEDGFRAIIAAHGGVVPLVASCVANLGGKRVQRPFCGAIGVLGSKTNPDRQFGAIHDGTSWRVRMINDYGTMCATPLAVWDIGLGAR